MNIFSKAISVFVMKLHFLDSPCSLWHLLYSLREGRCYCGADQSHWLQLHTGWYFCILLALEILKNTATFSNAQGIDWTKRNHRRKMVVYLTGNTRGRLHARLHCAACHAAATVQTATIWTANRIRTPSPGTSSIQLRVRSCIKTAI